MKKILILSLLIVCALATVRLALAATNSPSSKEIQELDSTIKQKRAQLDAIKKQQDAYKAQLAAKQNERATLQSQLADVDAHSAQTQLDLEQSKIDIETTNLEIQKVMLEINEQDKKISENKQHLGSALKLLSQEDNKSQLEILLMNDYLTDYLNQLTYLGDINGKISDTLGGLRSTKDALSKNQEALNANRERLRALQQELGQRQVALADEKDAKAYLIDQTKQSESTYQELLSQARQQQNAASADILNLEKTLRDKINAQGSDKIELKYDGFIWPIPSHTITAYFHDPSYPFRDVMEHSAIDLRTPQNTPIRAAAAGYVGRAKNGGMGYSYIMLLHANGLSTVYGHVSKLLVSDDEYVQQGQIIGLSGATPGTPGAGPFTTGPHLHFEVRLNGLPVNPTKYLP